MLIILPLLFLRLERLRYFSFSNQLIDLMLLQAQVLHQTVILVALEQWFPTIFYSQTAFKQFVKLCVAYTDL